jgi:hypothetical protein
MYDRELLRGSTMTWRQPSLKRGPQSSCGCTNNCPGTCNSILTRHWHIGSYPFLFACCLIKLESQCLGSFLAADSASTISQIEDLASLQRLISARDVTGPGIANAHLRRQVTTPLFPHSKCDKWTLQAFIASKLCNDPYSKSYSG